MAEAFLLIVRWTHAIAAVAWVGGGIFYWLILRPAIQHSAISSDLSRLVGARFGKLVMFAMWVLVITGATLFFARISEPVSTIPYTSVLATKVMLSAWMFFLATNRRTRAEEGQQNHGRVRGLVDALGHVNMTVVLGIIVFLLSDLLRLLVEKELEA